MSFDSALKNSKNLLFCVLLEHRTLAYLPYLHCLVFKEHFVALPFDSLYMLSRLFHRVNIYFVSLLAFFVAVISDFYILTQPFMLCQYAFL